MGEFSLDEYLATGDKELRRAMAMASLRENWRLAEEQGLDQIPDEEIRIVREQMWSDLCAD